MSKGRATFTGRMADLDFTLKTPAGFVEAALPPEEHDFDQPHVCAPLLLLSSPVALAVITVAARPGFASGTVRDWLVFLCQHNGIRLLSIGPAYVGGLHKNHPAIIATALQEQNGTELVMSLVALEDGGRFVTAHAMCPRELEPSYMRKMEASLHSFELLRHQGPTVNLEDNGAKFEIEILGPEPEPPAENEAEAFARQLAAKRDAAIERVRPLIAKDRFDEAALAVLTVDDNGTGRAALSGLFIEALREQVKREGKRNPAGPRALELYRRALQHRLSTYPDPHTQEEADRYSSGMDEDRAEVAAVLGYTPA